MQPSFNPIRSGLFRGQSPGWHRRLVGIGLLLLVAQLGVWGWAFALFQGQPVLLGTALLAYGFGLRHAVDADHIAAIDNTTRKLTAEGKRPLSVGLFFALGHSAVVILAALAIAATTSELASHFEAVKDYGAVIGTAVSAGFLCLIAAINGATLVGVWRAFNRVRQGGTYADHEVDALLNGRGFLARVMRPLFRIVSRPWHMFPLGFLFGLGFDTATEIGLLGISAVQGQQGLGVWSIMVFPALFTAGMTLIDTADGIIMLGVYDWAMLNPVRKLYYNLVITAVSIAVAVLIAGIEALGLLGDKLGLDGWFWSGIGRLNEHANTLGFIIVGVFVVAWSVSVIVYRYAGVEAAPNRNTARR